MKYHQATLNVLLLVALTISHHASATPLGLGGNGNGLLNRSDGLEQNLRPQHIGRQLSSREAVSIAERRYGGRAVGVRQIQTGSGVAYKVRILRDDGKIKNVVIDDN